MMSIAAGKHLLNDTFFFMMFLFFLPGKVPHFFITPPQIKISGSGLKQGQKV
jgi:hypothetical protein